MTRLTASLLVLSLLAACSSGDGSNPITGGPEQDQTDTDTDDSGDDGTDGDPTGDDTDDGDGIDSDGSLPPGTPNPTPNDGIARSEPVGEGSGTATDVRYDSATDRFFVDGLAFDTANAYTRGEAVGSLGPFAVYENNTPLVDNFNGEPVGQFTHRAIYGVSTSGETEFAIVRTGAYAGYGFGGFVYERENGVDIPTSGQGSYAGDYAGLRDFDGRSGLEYVQADAAMQIDFEDFNDGGGVRAEIFNRRIFDLAGRDITADVVDGLNAEFDSNIGTLPVIQFTISPGVQTANGELLGEAYTVIGTPDGAETESEGQFYAVMSGEDAREITGIVVLEGPDRFEDVTYRETGGFIVYRDPADRP
ncbi:hypothetical protein SAMN04490244_11059 [Tranquillimonas rosea]|uniref:Transferrin-binding protein B C-lobe/N-lobe beta barrel domain-containing protein n=1 Tax=Tranquillimonas rosea TaxID=641238 RepID=A0A1H9WC34_9RHOB|nr:hypothetical protein [Tranquillimonas rosea]SES31512.1 hypothetical protein SAMN04490244_11059 [Tranquillimonas rosea]